MLYSFLCSEMYLLGVVITVRPILYQTVLSYTILAFASSTGSSTYRHHTWGGDCNGEETSMSRTSGATQPARGLLSHLARDPTYSIVEAPPPPPGPCDCKLGMQFRNPGMLLANAGAGRCLRNRAPGSLFCGTCAGEQYACSGGPCDPHTSSDGGLSEHTPILKKPDKNAIRSNENSSNPRAGSSDDPF